jgi:hypothetical protein
MGLFPSSPAPNRFANPTNRPIADSWSFPVQNPS